MSMKERVCRFVAAYLMHIDNSYVRQGEVDAEKLFTKEDVTKQVSSILAGHSGTSIDDARYYRIQDLPEDKAEWQLRFSLSLPAW